MASTSELPDASSWPSMAKLFMLPETFAALAAASVSLYTSSTFAPMAPTPALTDSRLALALLEASFRTFTSPSLLSLVVPVPFTPTVVFRVGFTLTTPTPTPTPTVPAERPISRLLPVVEDLPDTVRLPPFVEPVFPTIAPRSTEVFWVSSLRT